MTNNENNNANGPLSWNSPQSLGLSVMQRHKNALRQPGCGLTQHHLGRDRISLAAKIYRQYHRIESSSFYNGEFPFFNFFPRAVLKMPIEGEGFLPHAGSLQRTGRAPPINAHSGVYKDASTDTKMQRYAGFTSTLPHSSAELTTPKLSASATSPNPAVLSGDISGQTRVLRKIGDSGEQPNVDNNPPSNTAKNPIESQVLAGQGMDQLNASTEGPQFTRTGNPASISRREAQNSWPDTIAMKPPISMMGASRKMLPIVEHLPISVTGCSTAFGFQVGNSRIGRHSTNIAQRVAGRGQFSRESMPAAAKENSVERVISVVPSYFGTNPNLGSETGLNIVSMNFRPDSTSEIRVARNSMSIENGRTEILPSHSSIQRAVTRFNGHGSNQMEANHVLTSSFHHFSPIIAKDPKVDQLSGIASENVGLKGVHSENYLPESETDAAAYVHAGIAMVNPKVFSDVSGDQHASERGVFKISRCQGPMQRMINRNFLLSPTHNAFVNSKNLMAKFKPSLPTQPESTTSVYAHERITGVPGILRASIDPNSFIKAKLHQAVPEPSPSEGRSNSSVQSAMSTRSGTLSRRNDLVDELLTKRYDNLESAGQNLTLLSPVQRQSTLSSINSEMSVPENSIGKSAPSNHALFDNDSGLSTRDYPTTSVSQLIGQQEQRLQNIQLVKLDSHPSVQRAVDRQNSNLSKITPMARIWNWDSEMPTIVSGNSKSTYHPVIGDDFFAASQQRISAKRENQDSLKSPQHAHTTGYQYHTNIETMEPIHSNSINSLLMRSAIIFPVTTTHRMQPTSGQQLSSIVSPLRRAVARKSDLKLHDNSTRLETAGLNNLILSAKAGSFSSGMENMVPEPPRSLSVEHGETFTTERTIRDKSLPLTHPYVVQRKTVSSSDHLTADDGADYLQRQGGNTAGFLTAQASPGQSGQTAGSPVANQSESNVLSTDDVVDKVWRKLMRKLVSEQERMGGSSRWAS